MVMIKSVDRLLGPALEQTLSEMPLTDADAALVALARSLAAAIDADERQGVVLAELGSKLLSTLVQLGATPAARRTLKAVTPGGPTRLDVLRAARLS
jgi:hypothetical protein